MKNFNLKVMAILFTSIVFSDVRLWTKVTLDPLNAL